MAADSYGARGEPQFAGSGSLATAEDLTLLGSRTAVVGNRMVGTSAERLALNSRVTDPRQMWPGLQFDELDTGDVYVVTQALTWRLTARAIDAPLTLNDNWSPANATKPVVAVRGQMASLPFIVNRGADTGQTMFTLPGYARPIATAQFDVPASSGSVVRVVIQTSGAVQVPAAGTFSGAYLSPCSWPLAI